jgi:hypothetical protein
MNTATARRLYLHVLHGGVVTPVDMSGMVALLEQYERCLEMLTQVSDAENAEGCFVDKQPLDKYGALAKYRSCAQIAKEILK